MLKWIEKMECVDYMESLRKSGQSEQWKGEEDEASTVPIGLSSMNV
jgi:hypothetical protein